jgi:DNA-binding IclR family transcriptional regulator
MIARHLPLPLSGMTLAVLDGIEPSEYRESLETSLEIASTSSHDLRKQIATIRETSRRQAKIFRDDY